MKETETRKNVVYLLRGVVFNVSACGLRCLLYENILVACEKVLNNY